MTNTYKGKCQNCEKIYKGLGRKYCSWPCYRAYARGEKSPLWQEGKEKVCEICGAKFRMHRDRYDINTVRKRGARTCSYKCGGELRKKLYHLKSKNAKNIK